MIRVLRLIEYEYNDTKMAENDMSRWQHPAIGSRVYGIGKVVRSTVLQNLDFDSDDSELEDHDIGEDTP